MRYKQFDGAHFKSIFWNIKGERFIKHWARGVPIDAWFASFNFFSFVYQGHFHIRIGRIAWHVDDFQISRFHQNDSEPFSRRQIRHRNHHVAQFDFGVLFGAQAKVLPDFRSDAQVQVVQVDLCAAYTKVPRIRVKVVQQHFDGATIDDVRPHFEHKIFVEHYVGQCRQKVEKQKRKLPKKISQQAQGWDTLSKSQTKYQPGLSVRLWIFVCQKLVLSGSSRILAYGSAVPFNCLGCKSFAYGTRNTNKLKCVNSRTIKLSACHKCQTGLCKSILIQFLQLPQSNEPLTCQHLDRSWLWCKWHRVHLLAPMDFVRLLANIDEECRK